MAWVRVAGYWIRVPAAKARAVDELARLLESGRGDCQEALRGLGVLEELAARQPEAAAAWAYADARLVELMRRERCVAAREGGVE